MECNTIQRLQHKMVGLKHRRRFFQVAWSLSAAVLVAAFAGFSSGSASAVNSHEALRARGLIIAGEEVGQKKSVNHDKPLHHYVFFGMDREKIKDAKSFLETPAFEGAQVAYSWRQLEQGKGPDLLPYKPGQMGSSYPLIREVAGEVPVGIAVQDGNSAYINPKTGKRVTIVEQIAFATEYLHTDYIFWCTEEPYYSNQLVPFLRNDKKGRFSAQE